MATSNIFYFRGHGAKTRISTSDGFMDIEMVNNLPVGALSDCYLVLYGACSTGKDGEFAQNLVNATAARGAEFAIGFQISVHCNEVNIWSKAFFEELARSRNILYAITVADIAVIESGDESPTTNSWYVSCASQYSYV